MNKPILSKGQPAQRGISLVELMVAITVGLIVAAAIISLYVSLIRSDSDNLKTIRLNQDLRATISLMARDLRRAGFNDNAADNLLAAAANPSQQMTIPVPAGDDCITYAYDEDKDGVHDAGELFGFQLNNGAIERLSGAACGGAGQEITDDDLIEITAFTVTDPDLLGDEVGDPPAEETAIPGKTVGGITQHRITLTLTGRLVRDNAVSRTVSETVEVRNVEY